MYIVGCNKNYIYICVFVCIYIYIQIVKKYVHDIYIYIERERDLYSVYWMHDNNNRRFFAGILF